MSSPRWTISEIKEVVLALLQFFWGILFMFPGNVFDAQGRYYLTAIYAQDWLWGILLLAASSLILFGSRTEWLHFRKFLHFFSWFFWLGIFILAMSRSIENGLHVADMLIFSPYITIAFLHATLYIRLMGVR